MNQFYPKTGNEPTRFLHSAIFPQGTQPNFVATPHPFFGPENFTEPEPFSFENSSQSTDIRTVINNRLPPALEEPAVSFPSPLTPVQGFENEFANGYRPYSKDSQLVHSGDANFSELQSPGWSNFNAENGTVLADQTEPAPESAEEAIADTSEAADLAMPTMLGGAALAYGVKELTNISNTSNVQQASQGLGPNGHAFDATYHAEQQANYSNTLSTVEGTALSVGSLFGPAGLAVGAATAATIGAIGSQFSPSENTTQGSSGNMVNASDLQ